MTVSVPHVGFVLEQTLGHVTHADNLRTLISTNPAIRASWYPIPFDGGWQARLPVYSNWSVRAGVRARRQVRAGNGDDPLDAMFIHTQVPAVLIGSLRRKIPTVVSLDATPLQYDELAHHYRHSVGGRASERLKLSLNKSCFDDAVRLVTWSQWAKAGLVSDYGVAPEKVIVIPPGVWVDRWQANGSHAPDDGVVRILFVGADLARKGGEVLLDAFKSLRAEHGDATELHLVTKSAVAQGDGVFVYASMSPNSSELKELYHRCDIFCLPTRADCLPMVLSEAGAAGLPLVSTAIGAISEIVRDGETGFTTPLDDGDALAAVLSKLVANRDLRHRLGAQASSLVKESFDAEKNANRLVALLRDVAAGAR